MTGYIIAFLYFLLFLYVFKKSRFFRDISGLTYPWLLFFFSLKVVSGIFLSLIYKHYYEPETADIYKYFNDGLYLYKILWKSPVDFLHIITGIGISQEHVDLYLSNLSYWFRPWESPIYNDNRVVIRFNALACLFSFGHLHVHTVFANLVSFTGLVALYKFFLNYMPGNRVKLLKWGVFLFPSLLFWGSGVLKEAILIGCFGVAVYLADEFIRNKKLYWPKVALFFICLWVLVLLKPYILILFLPCIAGFYVSRNMSFLREQLVYISLFAGAIVMAFLIHLVIPEYSPIYLMSRKHNDLINLALAVDAGSLLHLNYLKPEFFDILSKAPKGFITTLIRPHILEADTAFMLLAAVENLLILLLILAAIVMPSGLKKQSPLTFLSFWFCLAGFTFIGLTTPLAGAIVRYKILMLPFLWVCILNMVNARIIKIVTLPINKISNY